MLKLLNPKLNKNIYEDYIKYLLSLFYDYKKDYEIIINNHYITYKCFYPLPTKLIVEENNNNNIYSFEGNELKNKILFADRFLPLCGSHPIPFTFPIINGNKLELLNSNVYYYEVTILEKNEVLYIGFGSILLPTNSIPGWIDDSFSLDLNNGNYHNNTITVNNICPHCKINDVFGAGIRYISKSTYEPFFTYNGSLLSFSKEEIIVIKKSIVPLICFNSSNKIKLNFSQEEFKFNIKSYLFNNKVISNKNLFLNSNLNLRNINTKDIINKKVLTNLNINLLNIPMFSIIDNNLSAMLLSIINENNV